MVTTWNPVTKPSTPSSWTNVPKAAVPASGSVNIVAGNPIGLLLALTYATASSFSFSGWNNVSKAITPNYWTSVPKAT